MKKILIFTVCILLVCLLPIAVRAEGEAPVATADASSDVTEASGENLLSVRFEQWILPHLEEISVIVTMVFSLIYQMRKQSLLSRSIGTMNNNTVAIAEQSSGMMAKALTDMESASLAVTGYDERIAAMLEAFRSTAEDKERLEKEMTEIKGYLKTAAEANLEFSNELAELLNLANIPNFKKEEIGARHLAAVNAIKASEQAPDLCEREVNGDDGEEAHG